MKEKVMVCANFFAEKLDKWRFRQLDYTCSYHLWLLQ